MRWFILGLCLLWMIPFYAQSEQEGDTTIYKVLGEMPRFPVCEKLDTTLKFKMECATVELLTFMNNNIVYPLEAVQQNLEGSVVINFVVEKDGSLSNFNILKDIGGGCGAEAIRVAGLMNTIGIKWVPGKKDGNPVRSSFTLPIKFKLKEAPPYILIGLDTVYTKFDQPLTFNKADQSIGEYLDNKLVYPPVGNDSCSIGTIQVQLLVNAQGDIRILDMIDFSNLGSDFWSAAIDATTSTYGSWTPAVYEERNVPSAYDISLQFMPDAAACQQRVTEFENANNLMEEGAKLYDSGDIENGLSKMTEAINLFPDNGSFLIVRGRAYLDAKMFSEACQDLNMAKQIALINWYDEILKLICGKG